MIYGGNFKKIVPDVLVEDSNLNAAAGSIIKVRSFCQVCVSRCSMDQNTDLDMMQSYLLEMRTMTESTRQDVRLTRTTTVSSVRVFFKLLQYRTLQEILFARISNIYNFWKKNV